jgi:hypothetical protein
MYTCRSFFLEGFLFFCFLGPSTWPSPPYDPTDRSPITFHTSAWQNPSDPLPLMTWYTTTALDGGLRARAPPPKIRWPSQTDPAQRDRTRVRASPIDIGGEQKIPSWPLCIFWFHERRNKKKRIDCFSNFFSFFKYV